MATVNRKITYTQLGVLDKFIFIGGELELVALVRFDHKIRIDGLLITLSIRFDFNE